jgi:hypothetical protein
MDLRGDGRYLVAGLVAGAAVPAAVFLADIPFFVAVPIAVVLFGAIVFLLAPRRPLEGVDLDALGRGDVAAARTALESADSDLDAIEAVAQRIRTKDIAVAVTHLAATARNLLAQVEKEPAKLADVRRLIAVYLPRTREIATSFADIEGKGLQERARTERVRGVLKRIDDTFQHFGERMVEGEAKELDIELNLLEDSIKQELESRS